MKYPVHIWTFDEGNTAIGVANIDGYLYGVLELGLGLLGIGPTEAAPFIDNDGTLRRCVLAAERFQLDVPKQYSSSPPDTRYHCVPIDVFVSFLVVLWGRFGQVCREKRDVGMAICIARALKAYRTLRKEYDVENRAFTEQDVLTFQQYLDTHMQTSLQVRFLLSSWPTMLEALKGAEAQTAMLEVDVAMRQTQELKDKLANHREKLSKSREALTSAYDRLLDLATTWG